MRNLTTEQKITKVGVFSLATLAVIGIIATFLCACEIDLSSITCTFLEQLIYFIVVTLFILVGFCFPASFLINCSSIAASLKENRKNKEE
jgi:uncharacterized protein YacL